MKNTGRCRELLLPGVTVYLECSANPSRKTAYDLIAVSKGDLLINIDSQAPNRVVSEWLTAGGLFDDLSLLRPETAYRSSRFDFYAEHGTARAFIEVKGVTLEKNGILMFPDAPTERGVKHIRELCAAVSEGYEAYIIFVVQTDRAEYFTPNTATHPEFAAALSNAAEQGVHVLCYTCTVSPSALAIDRPIKVIL